MSDPEGNGIAVYADHPLARWHGPKGEIRKMTEPLTSTCRWEIRNGHRSRQVIATFGLETVKVPRARLATRLAGRRNGGRRHCAVTSG